jgi:hypothetical protein
LPGNKYAYADPSQVKAYARRIPIGSQNPDGTFTGDFRGIGITNPWGGKKKSRIGKKRRVSRRRTMKKRRYKRNKSYN